MKKLIACFVLMTAVATANAAYLYWQVDPSAGDNTASSFTTYNAARIGYYLTSDQSTGQTLAEMETAHPGTIQYSTADGVYSASAGSMGAAASFDLSGITSAENYSYFIELVNYDSASGTLTHVAYGQELAYANLVEKNYIDTEMSATTLPAIWHGGSFNAVPEPTGALMVMMGLALLGLKRREA